MRRIAYMICSSILALFRGNQLLNTWVSPSLVVNKLSVDTDVIKKKCCVSCNCILSKTYSLDEILRLSLKESYCLPVLEYATAAIRLSKYQVLELNIRWSFAKHESVRAFIFGLPTLDFLLVRKVLN